MRAGVVRVLLTRYRLQAAFTAHQPGGNSMRNIVIGFVAGVVAAHLFVSTVFADAESLREDRTLRVLERVASALERSEKSQSDIARSVRDAARCK